LPNAKGTFPLKRFISRFSDENTCREFLAHLRWRGGKPRCHQCGNDKNIYKYASRPIYKCSNCGTQFRVTTGTPFENSKIKLSDWFLAIKLMACTKKSLSSYQLAKELGVTQKTAWYMETNIRVMLGNKAYKSMLSGIVEADEVYMVRDVSKKTKQGHGTNKQKVFGLRQRNSENNKTGELRIMIVDKVNSRTLHNAIALNVEEGSWLMTDDFKAYYNLEYKYKRGVVNHSKRQYVDGNVHTNSIEGSWSHLRKLVSAIYHRPSPEHLQKYCDEFEFRYNNRGKSLEAIFRQVLKQCDIHLTHAEIKKNLRPLAGKRTKK
jgi:transposase-like protein